MLLQCSQVLNLAMFAVDSLQYWLFNQYNVKFVIRKYFALLCFFLFVFTVQAVNYSREIVPGPKISIAESPRDEVFPEISYNPVEKNFLIAWIDYLYQQEPSDLFVSRVRARFLRSDTSLGPLRTYITNRYSSSVLVQYDSQNNRYFMVWDAFALKYRLLGPSGGVMKAGQILGEYSTAITYHPLIGEYLVATPLQRFSSNGEPKGAVSNDVVVSAILLPDPKSSNYFYFYSQIEPEVNIYHQILQADGTPVTTPRRILRHWSEFSVAFNPLRREFLFVYGKPGRQWRAVRLSENGQEIGSSIALGNKCQYFSSAIFYDEHFFVAYNQANRVFLRKLNANAQLLGPSLALTDEGATVTEFEIARGNGRNSVIVWTQPVTDLNHDIHARIFRLP